MPELAAPLRVLAHENDWTRVLDAVRHIEWVGGRPHVGGNPLRFDEQLAASAGRDCPDARAAVLAAHLYTRYYTNRPEHLTRRLILRDTDLSKRWIAHLDAQNRGTGSHTSGWSVEDDRGERLRIRGPGGVRVVPRAALQGDRLVAPKGSATLQTGWYYAVGNVDGVRVRADLRLYFAATAPAAGGLMAHLTGHLNDREVPFRLKVVSDPQQLTRADGAVLYANREDWPVLHEAVSLLPPRVLGVLNPIVPRLTLPLARGVALAEDPGGGRSYGLHRCSLLANTLVDGVADEGALKAGFTDQGYDPEHPYLDPGSSPDAYLEAFA